MTRPIPEAWLEIGEKAATHCGCPADTRAVIEAVWPLIEAEIGEHWAKTQLIEAHKLLSAMGVPGREVRPDYNRGKAQLEDKEFSLGVPERIKWLREKWQPADERKPPR
jgi:hypothetical protein